MSFVKLDTRILNSTIWMDGDACKLFITALLMAEPTELKEPTPTVNTFNTDAAEFVVPPGWYGFVPAAGPGIVWKAMLEQDVGMKALDRLAKPDPESRTSDHEGRRMVRVNGGFIILNYIAHRDRDHSNAERQARFRQREKERKLGILPAKEGEGNAVIVTGVTHAYADADVEEKKKQKKPRVSALRTFSQWVESLNGTEAIPADHSVFEYADLIKLPSDFLRLAWVWFTCTYGADPKGVPGLRAKKTYKDWPAVFRKSVEDNWGKLWYLKDDQYALTAAGAQLKRANP